MKRFATTCLLLTTMVLATCAVRAAGAADPTPFGMEGPQEVLHDGKPLGDWVADLKNPDAAVRLRSVQALGAMGQAAEDAVPALRQGLWDENANVRIAVTAAVCRIGGRGARDMVREMLVEGDDRKSKVAFPSSLKEVGAVAVPYVRELLTDDQAQGEALSFLGPDAVKSLPGLLDALAHAGPQARAGAARVLGMMKPAAPEVVPALTRALDDADGRVRCRAALALWLIAKNETKTVPVLAAGLTHEDRQVRREAATALQQFGRAALPAAAELAEVAKNGDLDVSDTAATTFQGIGPEAIPALVRALPDRAAPTHWRIVLGLQAFGPKAADAVPELLEELQGPNPSDRLLAAEALIAIDPQTAGRIVPVLVAAAADDDPYVVSRAAALARTIGPDAAVVGPTLAIALRHPNATVRLAAADALVRLDQRNAAVALPVLIDALTNGEQEDKQEAVETLIFLRADAKPAAPALARQLGEALLGHNEGLNWRQLTKALTAMGAGAEAVPALVQVMYSGDEEQRQMAIAAAGTIGPDARGAVTALRAALKDEGEYVRESAARALKKITGVDPMK